MKMMLRRLAIVVCVALALLSAAYAFAVLRTHSGTGFWKVWLVLAVIFALLAHHRQYERSGRTGS